MCKKKLKNTRDHWQSGERKWKSQGVIFSIQVEWLSSRNLKRRNAGETVKSVPDALQVGMQISTIMISNSMGSAQNTVNGRDPTLSWPGRYQRKRTQWMKEKSEHLCL